MIPLRRILYPTDFSAPSARALEYAISLAQQHSSMLYLLHVIVDEAVVPVYADPLGAIMPTLRSPARNIESSVREAIHELVPASVRTIISVECLIRHGRPIVEILNCAEEIAADIIVCGTHGYAGWKRLIFGTIVERLVRTASCPVLVVR